MDPLTSQREVDARQTALGVFAWVTFGAAVVLLLLMLLLAREMMGGAPEEDDILFYVGLGIAPAALAAILTLRRRYGWVVPIGLWYTFIGVTLTTLDDLPPVAALLLFVAALVLCFAPLVAKNLR